MATCEVGDLSGKHGNLLPAADAATPVTASYTDSQVMLYGKNSIVGRSVVIHSADASAARLQCATIVEETTGAITELMAVFRGEDIRGYMLFRQAVTSDGTVGDTVAFYDVQGLGGYTGPLNWHIHDAPISSPGDCASAGGHFDPTLYGTESPAVIVTRPWGILMPNQWFLRNGGQQQEHAAERVVCVRSGQSCRHLRGGRHERQVWCAAAGR